ncbi:hypothetical protein IWX49DRAFT_154857 [Phyllosticta citricarpa]
MVIIHPYHPPNDRRSPATFRFFFLCVGAFCLLSPPPPCHIASRARHYLFSFLVAVGSFESHRYVYVAVVLWSVFLWALVQLQQLLLVQTCRQTYWQTDTCGSRRASRWRRA